MNKTIKFELNEKQTERFVKWRDKQADKACRRSDSFGFRFQFIFGPTSMGDNVEVLDVFTGDRLNLTLDYEDDEFLYNEDGSKNGW